jgi:hypothetical protein
MNLLDPLGSRGSDHNHDTIVLHVLVGSALRLSENLENRSTSRAQVSEWRPQQEFRVQVLA